MLSIVISTLAYFVANHYIKQYLNDSGAPHGFTRSVSVFCAAMIIAYAVALIVDGLVA